MMNYKKKYLALAIASLLISSQAYAVTCKTSCIVTDDTFSVIEVSGTETEAIFTAPEVVANLPLNGKNVKVSDGSLAHFEGSLTIQGTAANNQISNSTGLVIENGGQVIVDKDFKIMGTPISYAPGLINMTSGTLTIKGDAEITTFNNSNSGAAIYLGGNSVLNVDGKTTIDHLTSSSRTMALSVQDNSKASFNELEINARNHFTFVAGGEATVSSTGITSITNDNSGDGIWFGGKSLISLGENANVTAAMEANRSDIAQLNIGKDASVSTTGNGDAIYILGSIATDNIITIKGSVSADSLSGGTAIHSANSAISNENIYLQGGNIIGNIDVQKGNDTFVLQSGSLKGNSYMGEGDDRFLVEGGKIEGNIDMGDGNDHFQATGGKIISSSIHMGKGKNTAYITGDADISELKSLSAGDVAGDPNNTSTLIFAQGDFSGWSLYNPTSQGVQLHNWSNINLVNNTNFTMTGSYLLVLNSLNIDGSSTFKSNDGGLTIQDYGSKSLTVNNGGTMTLANDNAGEVWQIKGNYNGNYGQIEFDTILQDDSSLTDRLIIEGDSSGVSYVKINNLGGLGAETLNGIEIITVKGESKGEFIQNGRIVAGAYDYKLQRSKTDDKNWVLFSNLATRPEIGGYLGNLYSANNLFNLRLHDRLGETQYTDLFTGERKVTSMWLRHQFGYNKFQAANGDLSVKNNWNITQLGGDIAQWSSNNTNRLHLGIIAGYGRSTTKSDSNIDSAKADGTVDGYSYGVYATWYDNNDDKTGLYLDTWALWNNYDASVGGDDFNQNYRLKGLTASIESGYSFLTGKLGNYDVWLQPKGQIIWSDVKANDFTESNGTQVSFNHGNLQTRLGFRASLLSNAQMQAKNNQAGQLFLEANWLHNTKLYDVTVDDLTIQQDGARNIGELKVGVEGYITKSTNIWFNLAGQRGDHDYENASIMLGLKYSF